MTTSTRTSLCSLCLLLGLLGAGCGSEDDSDDTGGDSGNNGSFDPGGGSGDETPSGPLNGIPSIHGSYKLGDAFTGKNAPTSSTANAAGCGTILTGVVRDFKDSHPDFEKFSGDTATKNMVRAELGSDGKPVYADDPSRRQSTGEDNFDQWYRNVKDVNSPYLVRIELVQNGQVATFESDKFFPLDGAGFGNQNREHNYHFTTEFHTEFKYNGGETFRFVGDDDLWVFINKRLAIDLGGLHSQLADEVNLDSQAARLGLEKGKIYDLSLFHAERHTVDSHFRIDTTMTFVNCGKIPDVVE